MSDQLSALQLILNGDAALFAIVRLSLAVSLSAVVLAALVGMPLGALLGGEPLSRARRAGGAAQRADGLAAGRGRACGLSAAVAIRSARGIGHSVHARRRW